MWWPFAVDPEIPDGKADYCQGNKPTYLAPEHGIFHFT
jgi:hypothetical protein